MSENQFLTVQEIARLYNKSVQTVYRNIKTGKLSRQDNGLIALSECLRAYGVVPKQSVIAENNGMANDDNISVIKLLQNQIDKLEKDLQALKAEGLERERQAIEREKRLMALLEHQTGAVAPAEKMGGLFAKFFK